ncbi:sodium- and chloride-dependent neutral and basic amino acid transporter B(0+) [Episyrphus balteatus]|uniref:sodium- and chloride-dependent neutral and basic amino acid transporter B(0+) n=1 Tax=Episyrphus balteatus TaxID=286459 RepID=UPI002485E9C4|nr:sodium- and chloride-dependent neutral and basic amino acid transporter B(0+) [Episyrphus balteatus]XP_055841038.1 sodium- and chloride-dependent neutral and basic amino acid transporter B(0+) [Episyrphus balteatus]XP_055841039.1 sodium- and chloride-dependent neutral and basic amino acid transporter B(0+) [Episyrphus balteatus]XP_055841040.1 sodium- and chloride-dependent neutral and basic amino acid transporter B(0+) [Episyrphus balteatus]XP_055841041.1 sodium- and chloride-dependent neutr
MTYEEENDHTDTKQQQQQRNHRFSPNSNMPSNDENTISRSYKPRTSSSGGTVVLAEHLRAQQQQQSSNSNLNTQHFKSNRASGRLYPPSSEETNRARSSSGGGGKNFTHSQRAAAEGGIYIISGKSTNSNPSTMDRRKHMGPHSHPPPPHPPQNTASYSSATGMSSVSSANGIGSESSHTTNDVISECQSNYAGNEVANGDFHFVTAAESSPTKNLSSGGSFNLKSGSTVKLLPAGDEDSNTQTKCSVFRGLVLCICLNVSYANIVRFPRELDRYGSAYLIPYLVLLFLVGLPTILLEISIGQFLGQGAAHTWRSSPIFKGACIVSRFASWLASIWISLQAVISVAYIGMFLTKLLPFNECVGDIKLALNGYKVVGNNGVECIQKTFLTPFWENPLYFGLLAIGLIFIWMTVMFCTHNAKVYRRISFFFGLIGFALLCSLTSWEVHTSLERQYFPELWPFKETLLLDSSIWFNALVQVIYATNIGFGALPVVTGKFLYKGDAVRTSVVYLCFNLLVNAISVTLFMVQFDNLASRSLSNLEALKPLTAIYDRVLNEPTGLLAKLIPCLIYSLIVISAIVSITVAIYTSTRLVPRHPNYVISLIGFVAAVIALAAPKFIIPRVLDTRIVGTLVITALIFDLIATTWIYGAKNIYTDLEFSIGRPIFKGWVYLWCLGPAFLTGVLVWWCADDDEGDLLNAYMPRWAPILFVIGVILIIACVEIFKQVDYNFFGMICEAAKPAKEWGPADPLARHAWKQWRSVCQDTGRKDFTLRRRGTRDYTHSIKKGQYSTSKYGTNNWKSSTPGNSSPNYSGSVFGDSAIEEDISVDKYSGINQQFTAFQGNDGKGMRYSNRSRQPVPTTPNDRRLPQHNTNPADRHKEVVYIRRLSNGEGNNHSTRIEITPSKESITYGTRNPMGRNLNQTYSIPHRTNSVNRHPVQSNGQVPVASLGEVAAGDHICWRKFSVNAEEYSTEL